MVLITNTSDRMLFRRLPNGQRIAFDVGETKEVKSKRLTEALELQKSAFRIEKSHLIPTKTGRRRDRKESLPSEHTDNVDDAPSGKWKRRIDKKRRSRERAKSEDDFGKPKQDSKKPRGLKKGNWCGTKPLPSGEKVEKPKGLRLPKEYYKLGLKNGWRKFKEDKAKAEVID